MTERLHILRPFDRREAIAIGVAAKIAGVSVRTVGRWCEEHHIGRRIAGGHWRVSRPALLMLLDDDRSALHAYLAGERGERVAEYFQRAGNCAISDKEDKARKLDKAAKETSRVEHY